MKKGWLGIMVMLSMVACAKGVVTATTHDGVPVEKSYFADTNKVYYAVRWAMEQNGYPVAREDLQNGHLESGWLATKSDSHYIPVFGRQDYGVNGSYYKFNIDIIPDGSQTHVKVTSEMKTLIHNLASSGREEKALLAKTADFLRTGDVPLTNVGIEENKEIDY